MLRLLRRALLPPAYHEELGPAQWKTALTARAVVVASAIVLDATIASTLGNAPGISAPVLHVFATVNLSLLGLDLAVTLAMVRFDRLRRLTVMAALGALEAVTAIVWVQATGTLTSYFVLMSTLVMVLYRVMFSYRVSAATFVSAVVCHAAALALEAAGVLRPEALFLAGPSAVYDIPMYRISAMSSMFMSYGIMFMAANLMVNRLREKDMALAEVQREAARAAEDARHGRLTGTLVAGEFAMGELIGRGGMGEVYLARRVSDESTVAVKVLHAHLLDDEIVLERFRREAEIAGRIAAQYVPQVFAIGCDQTLGVSYIAMEYLAGEDLGAYLRRHGVMTEEQFLPLAYKAAAAIDAAHEAGVIHRDLKPQNLFLTYRGALGDSNAVGVRILDFGVSKVADSIAQSLTQTYALMGTPGYLSPEQAMGARDAVGPATDRFAFAAIVYRALTGRAPFAAPDLIGAIHEVLKTSPPRPTSLNPKLAVQTDLVLTIGLARKPEERYATARALVDDLAAAASGKLAEDSIGQARQLARALPPSAPAALEETLRVPSS